MYRFECTLCGDCCSGLQDIRLNPEDLTLISHFLTKPIPKLYEMGLVEDRPENGVPRPWIKFKTWPMRFCPFLINDLQENGTLRSLCSLHPHHKPLVCALSPLGRILTLPEESEEWFVQGPVEGCPGMGLGPEKDQLKEIARYRDRLDRETAWLKTLIPFPDSQPGT